MRGSNFGIGSGESRGVDANLSWGFIHVINITWRDTRMSHITKLICVRYVVVLCNYP